MEKKKILFIVEAMGGGIYTYITNLANELAKNNDVYIAYSVRKETPPQFSREFYQKCKINKS